MNFRKSFYLGLIGSLLLLSVQSCDKANLISSQDANTITDIDGNLYHTIKIGKQLWTVENFRSTKFNDSSKIPLVADSANWTSLISPGFCWCVDDISIRNKSGALYNWYAVNTHKLAPAGWHVPTDSDWFTLEFYLISNGFNWDGKTDSNKIAKSLAAKTDWQENTILGSIGNDLSKNNKSGFTAMPNGLRDGIGILSGPGNESLWWSSTASTDDTSTTSVHDTLTACIRYLGGLQSDLYKLYGFKNCGFAVRLLKD